MRVLLIDDEPAIGRSFARVWRHSGIEVTVLQDPLAVEAALAEATYDVVVSDFSMPGRNGLDVLAIVKRDAPAAKRVLMTGTFGPMDRATLAALEPLWRFQKPVSPKDLLALVSGS